MGSSQSNAAGSNTSNLLPNHRGQSSFVNREASIISRNNSVMTNTMGLGSHTTVSTARSFARNGGVYSPTRRMSTRSRSSVPENYSTTTNNQYRQHQPNEADSFSSSPSSGSHIVLNRPYDIARSDTLNTVQADDVATISDVFSPVTTERLSYLQDNVNPPHTEHITGSSSNPYVLSSDEEDNDDHDYNPITTVPSNINTTTHHSTLGFCESLTSRLEEGTNKCSGTIFVKNASSSPRRNVDTVVAPSHCLNPATDINARLDTQVEVRVYPCNNSSGQGGKRKFTQFTVRPEGVIIQGTNRHRSVATDLGAEYALHVGRKLQRYELSDTRACQLLVTTHKKSFWVVPAPEAFSRHSGTCRLLGDRKHPLAPHTLQVGDFLRVGSVGVVVIETHNGVENRILSEERIQKIMKDTTNSNGGFLDLGETDVENSDDSFDYNKSIIGSHVREEDMPVCYMCFDDENTDENPLITPCKCRGDTRYVHVGCLRKWHTAEADNQICFLSSVHATCSVCKSSFKSDFKLRDGRLVKLFKSSLEPPYVSLLVATKHEMAQRLFNTRFQLSFSTLMRPDGNNSTRSLFLGRSSLSDMVLDYRTVSASHATIKFKSGEFIFTDVGSSNGSYLYLRRPVELSTSQPVQFRLGRSMISMKVVSKWNRRILRAVRRTGTSNNLTFQGHNADDHSVGSNDDDVRITNGKNGQFTRSLPRRTRESIMDSLPVPGMLSQQSSQHLDLLFALAYPKRNVEIDQSTKKRELKKEIVSSESRTDEGKLDDIMIFPNNEDFHVNSNSLIRGNGADISKHIGGFNSNNI